MHQYHKWLRSFYAVAYKGSFTAAAEYLSIGQPTVSEQVKALEKVYKVELFHRNGGFIEMSIAGQQLYEIAKPLFKLEEEAIHLLQSFQQKKGGMFRIGAVSPPIAMELTYKLRMEYPDIDFKTSFYSASGTLEKLRDFDIDIAILARPAFEEDLYTQVYKRYPIIAVVRDDHPWVKEKSISVQQIQNENMVLREHGSQTRFQVEKVCDQAGISMNCVMQLNSREAIFHAISQGVGIGFVAEVEYVEMPNLRPVHFVDHPFYIEYRLCCLSIRKDRAMISDVFKQHVLAIHDST
ncbi:LysR substrate-binding domain-containing protein [Acinetobacter sp. ANC 3813]|uniref:LysR substrate-binding domain-containing protein n=1 Tax=Acinetobacter sp. ANC 3813 TaxID=1977873 RepID=UPI000A32DB36|nr:LysR substrate-binding domain-containing protein [Acinetobacter sp. ANC 3813]OTG92250.1 LysR family transcriptional regulator [Acinetobacter sp. ANC 3813]